MPSSRGFRRWNSAAAQPQPSRAPQPPPHNRCTLPINAMHLKNVLAQI
jgi:hypothetical protein